MKKHLIYIYLLASSCHTNDKTEVSKQECEKFKRGKFIQTWDKDSNQYKIERNDSNQLEFIGAEGDYIHLKVKWTGPCSYELAYLSQHITGTDSVLHPSEIRKLQVDILQIRNDSCFIVGDNGIDQVKGIIYIDKK